MVLQALLDTGLPRGNSDERDLACEQAHRLNGTHRSTGNVICERKRDLTPKPQNMITGFMQISGCQSSSSSCHPSSDITGGPHNLFV